MSARRALLIALGVLAGGPLVLVLAFIIQGQGLLLRAEAHPVPALRIAPAPSRLARGRHLLAVACADCHAPAGDTALAGSDANLLDVPGGRRWGRLFAPNLTPGGGAASASDGEWSRAIREGVRPDHRAMLVHPAAGRDGLSDADLAAILTALRAEPARANSPPARQTGPWLALGLGARWIETSVTHPVPWLVREPAAAPDTAQGRYLAAVMACGRCHGAALDGRRPSPLAPAGPDLLAWSRAHGEAEFARVLRDGADDDGHAIDERRMPLRGARALTDDEVAALGGWLRAISAER